MPVAVNFGDEFAIHEDAERWRYVTIVGDITIAELLDDDGQQVGTDVIVENIVQIQQMSAEEAEELIGIF